MNNDELLIAIKDMFDNKFDELKQHVEILIEKQRGDIKAIAEGHSILDRKMDGLDMKVTGLDRKVDSLGRELNETKNELKNEIAMVKDYVIGVDTKLNEHEVILKRVK